jgi:hypothetical protein
MISVGADQALSKMTTEITKFDSQKLVTLLVESETANGNQPGPIQTD